MAIAGAGAGAEVDVERYEKTLEAKKLLQTLGFVDRYARAQEDFLAKLATEPDFSPVLHRALAQVLKETDFEASLADMVGMFMRRDDLVAANKYNAGAVGQKEVAMILRLEGMVKQGELDVSEVGSAEEAFYANLSDGERTQALAFHSSDAGQRYGRALGAIDGQLRTVFMTILKAAIPKALERCADEEDEAVAAARAANNGRTATGPSSASPSPGASATAGPSTAGAAGKELKDKLRFAVPTMDQVQEIAPTTRAPDTASTPPPRTDQPRPTGDSRDHS